MMILVDDEDLMSPAAIKIAFKHCIKLCCIYGKLSRNPASHPSTCYAAGCMIESAGNLLEAWGQTPLSIKPNGIPHAFSGVCLIFFPCRAVKN